MAQPLKYKNISGAATTVVLNGPGFLKNIVINTPVASGTVTIYDNTAASGNKIGTITLPATLVNEGPNFASYEVNCFTGLTVVTTGAGIDITVSSM